MVLKVWSLNQQQSITWERARNSNHQAPPPIYWSEALGREFPGGPAGSTSDLLIRSSREGIPWWSSSYGASQAALVVKNLPSSERHGFNPCVRKITWRRAWRPIQYSCPEKPMDRGAWWAMVHGVAQSWTRLKGLSMHTRGWIQCSHYWGPRVQSLVGELRPLKLHGKAKTNKQNCGLTSSSSGKSVSFTTNRKQL